MRKLSRNGAVELANQQTGIALYVTVLNAVTFSTALATGRQYEQNRLESD
jgi:hypothetical protein